MKTCTLRFPLGRTERVSRHAAEFALLIDRIEEYPQLSKSLDVALESIKVGFAGVETHEKVFGYKKTKELIEKSFRPPSIQKEPVCV